MMILRKSYHTQDLLEKNTKGCFLGRKKLNLQRRNESKESEEIVEALTA